MLLVDIIPHKLRNKNWGSNSKYLLIYKYVNIPVAFIKDDIVFIYFDVKIKKEVIEIIKHLVKNDIKFFLTNTDDTFISKDDLDDKIIFNYLHKYSNEYFYDSINEIGFDVIKNMIEYARYKNCEHLIENEVDIFIKYLNRRKVYNFDGSSTSIIRKDILNYFTNIHRSIKITQLIN